MGIDSIEFGSITIDGRRYAHDVVVYPEKVERRKKHISKEEHGTSHKFSRNEILEYLKGLDLHEIKLVVVGTGQYGKLSLLDETKKVLEDEDIEVIEVRTPEAIRKFNSDDVSRKEKIGIFHVTC